MGAERLIANNPRQLDVDALEHIVSAAHSGDRASLRDRSTDSSSDDLTTTAGAR
jgi:alcohol dehydrogenase